MACTVKRHRPLRWLSGLGCFAPFLLLADGLHQMPDEIIVIHGKKLFQNKGAQAGRVDLQAEDHGLLRTGDILESVPGLAVSQHSGSGKANQYFLRGVNLDHGTDFATSVDGIPVNARSHGHGQGYTDLNFLIPELLAQLDYQKGPVDARSGDFASAGSVQMSLTDQIDPQLGVTVGPFGYRRLLAAGTLKTAEGHWLNGAEAQSYDGPWQGISEDVKKYNLWSRYSEDTIDSYLSLTLMAYQNQWNAADQIPARLIAAGVSRFYAPDEGAGGDSYRYSLSSQWQKEDWALHLYALQSRLNLWSDFTYFLHDPVAGDQFYQLDDRRQWGGELNRQSSHFAGFGQWHHQYGLQVRVDNIAPVTLAQSQNRQTLAVVSTDSIDQWSTAIFSQQQWLLSDSWSVETGLRYDWMALEVRDLLTRADNTEQLADGIASVRAGILYQTDIQRLALRYGQGLHSNDARGIIEQSATENMPWAGAQPVWSRTRHLELSWQAAVGKWQTSVSLWHMLSASELLYVADAAETELQGASRRLGIEGTFEYQWNHQWSVGVEYALTKARLDNPAEGPYIEGSVPGIFVARLRYHSHDNLQWQLKIRQLGPRPLDSTAKQQTASGTQVSMQFGGLWQQLSWRLEFYNMLNSKAADMQYFYESRLANEAKPVADRHIHPLEPSMLRLSLSYMF